MIFPTKTLQQIKYELGEHKIIDGLVNFMVRLWGGIMMLKSGKHLFWKTSKSCLELV